MKQRNNIFTLILVCCLCFVLMTGCVFPKPPAEPIDFKITIDENIEHGSIQCEKTTANADETITVTAKADPNYQLVSITVNGAEIDGNSFVMPKADVVISATFALAADLTQEVPEGALKIKAQSAGGASATGHIFMTFGESGVTFEAFVEDSSVVEKDGVAILFSRELPVIAGLLPNGQTIKISVNGNGEFDMYATDDAGYLQAVTLEGVATDFDTWSKNGEKLDGYHVKVLVPYAALGVTAETAKGNITVCPVVYSAYGSLPATGASLEGVTEDAQNTFSVLLDDNSVRVNKYNELSAQLGSFGAVSQGKHWDLSKDYYADDAENYPNREALLTGHDGNDNNLVFYRVSANEMYVRATLTVTGNSNPNDQWPKFGLMLFDGQSKRGVYFYVDAIMSQQTGNTIDNIIGQTVGYNMTPGPDWSSSWIGVKDGAFNLETKSIVMEMVYQNGWVHMYADGQLVKTIYYGTYNENLHFGIKSFGIDLKVTDYLASDDAEADGWADKKIAPPDAKAIDILFAGDSYMEFWKNQGIENHLSYTGATYENIGVGGTKVQYWIDKAAELATLYVPSKIAFHIGVNDIDDDNANPAEVIESLKVMFEKYHEEFPDATIYWNSLIPNTMFAGKYADYKTINAAIEEYTSDKEWLVYIDQTTIFDNNGAARQDVFSDGLHLTTPIGYPLWARVMLNAMGYERPDGTVMGDIDGFAHTGLWTFNEDGSAHSIANRDTALWFKNISGENVYVEAVVNIGALCNPDDWTKFGFVVRNGGESIFAYIDAHHYPQPNTLAAMINYGTNAAGFRDWLWGTEELGNATGCDFANVKLAIAKLGNTVYFLVNDVVYMSRTLEGEVSVGYLCFNLETTISNVVTSTDSAFIQKQLLEKHSIKVVGENAGLSVDIVDSARMGDIIEATINVVEGQKLAYVKVNGVEHEVVEGKVTFTMPDADVTIEVALEGIGVSSEIVNNSGENFISATVNCETATATVGQTVTFTVDHSAGSKIAVSVNGEALTANEGTYYYTVKATDTAIAIKVELDYALSEAIDGVKGEGYGTPLAIKVDGGRCVTVWAKTDDNGVYFYVEAYTNSVVTDGAAWWQNHNFEFYLNHGAQSYVNANGASNGASKSVYNYAQQENGKYLNTVELYVNKGHINGFNPESVTLNYAFKAPGELARYEYMMFNYAADEDTTQAKTDWWRTSHSTPISEHIEIGTWGVPSCIHITGAGIVHDCERASIDGDLSEYEGKNAFIGIGNDNAKFDFTGYVAEDGVYLGITIYQNKLGEHVHAWWNNDNLEIKLLGDRAGFTLIDDFIAACGPVRDYALVRTDGGDSGFAYKTVVELFYAHDFSTAKQATFQVGVNGNGFGGWQALIWDGNIARINENGIEWIAQRGLGSEAYNPWPDAQLDVAEKMAAGEGIVLDGKADEAFYAGLTSVTFDNVNGAKMVVTGRKLSTGIIVLNTITHTKPITDVLQGAGTGWWEFLNVEYRMGGKDTPLQTSTFNGFEAYCSSASATVDNGDGTYTTTFETFLPFTTEYGGMNYAGDVQVCIGGVIEQAGFIWITGWIDSSRLFANEKGFILK